MPLPNYKEKQAEKAERERRKQEQMPKPWWWFKQHDPVARFTLYLGLFTFLLFVATAGLWIATRDLVEDARDTSEKSLRLTQQSVEIAATQAQAATIQANAAASSVSISTKELIVSHRAWVGPTLARFDSEPIIGKPIIISVNYQNTGREPAINSTATVDVEPIDIPVSKTHEGKWKRLFNSCMSSDKSSGGQVIYPNIGGTSSSYTITYTSNADIVDSALLRGDRALLVQGCFRYMTMGVQRHSYYCFFYRANRTDYRSLGFCPSSNYVD